MKQVAGHGSFTFLPPRYPREEGLLVVARPDGTELRLHRTEAGRWEAIEWREATTATGERQWVGPGAGPLDAADWVACGAALAAVPSQRNGEPMSEDTTHPVPAPCECGAPSTAFLAHVTFRPGISGRGTCIECTACGMFSGGGDGFESEDAAIDAAVGLWNRGVRSRDPMLTAVPVTRLATGGPKRRSLGPDGWAE